MESSQPLKCRILCSILVLTSFLLYRSFWQSKSTPKCMRDAIHEWSLPFNRQISLWGIHSFIGLAQILMDGLGIVFLLLWIISFQNARIFSATGLFYAVRAAFLTTTKFPFPRYVVWVNPGFPSLFVPYDKTRDFFYSGHTGLTLIIALEFGLGTNYPAAFKVFLMLCVCYMAILLPILRVHYSVDVIAGILYALEAHWIADRTIIWMDSIWNAPFHISYAVYSWLYPQPTQEDNCLVEPQNEVEPQDYVEPQKEELV